MINKIILMTNNKVTCKSLVSIVCQIPEVIVGGLHHDPKKVLLLTEGSFMKYVNVA